MASQFWDEKRAERCSQFRYEFPVDSVRQKTVVVAGGSGGLGALPWHCRRGNFSR
jgi:hypothetical protein